MNVGSLFSGIGGFDLGLERAGMRTSWFCEQDEFCHRVLAKHWPGVPCHPDIRELTADHVEPVDVLCGGGVRMNFLRRDRTPICQHGVTRDELVEILGERLPEFDHWMCGQTVAICEGRLYDHDRREYYDDGCGPHGVVVYTHDLARFVAGLPVVD